MLSSYKNLAGRYMKASKKRTIFTAIGIILSVALITSIGLFLKGIEKSQIEMVSRTTGAFHLAVQEPSADIKAKVAASPRVESYGMIYSNPLGNVTDKLKAFEYQVEPRVYGLIPFQVKSGSYPVREGEVAIEEWALKYLAPQAKVYDEVKIAGKSYKLTGILENSVSNQRENTAVLLKFSDEKEKTNGMLLVQMKTSGGLRKNLDELESLLPKDSFGENLELLMWQNGIKDTRGMMGLYIVLAVIIGIVFISTVAMIYNAFQISVVERMKQFGLLRAVGATPVQIRRIVYKEAGNLALIAIPLGLVGGVIAIYCIGFVFGLMGGESVMPMKPGVSFGVLGVSALVSIVSIYCSALIPAFHAGRISPLTAISSRLYIKKDKAKKTKSKIAGAIFGIEGSMASKNIKRNIKRYRVTVFSIALSVMLFITFKSFMDMSLNVSKQVNESDNIHFAITRDDAAIKSGYGIPTELLTKVRGLDNVQTVYAQGPYISFKTEIPAEKTIKEISDLGKVYTKKANGAVELGATVQGYDDGALAACKGYLTGGTNEKKALDPSNGVLVIERNTLLNEASNNNFYGKLAALKVGDTIRIANGIEPLELHVAGILKAEPFNYYGGEESLKLVTSKEVAWKIAKAAGSKEVENKTELKIDGVLVKLKDPKQYKVPSEKMDGLIAAIPELKVVNYIDQNKEQKTGTLMIQILLYGFVVVISLIGSVNIFNTITTNMILRKREMATLKAIGMSQRGLKRMIVLEGFIYGMGGLFYGSIAGLGLSYLMYSGLVSVREMTWPIPVAAILIAAVGTSVVSYGSVLAPLKRMGKENLIEAIREDY